MRVWFNFFGISSAITAIQELLDAVINSTERGYWVASAADYGLYLEYGTWKMQARPHWRPAVEKLTSDEGVAFREYSRADGGIKNVMLAGGEISKIFAIMLRNEVKANILAKGIYRTGNYYNSIAIGEGRQSALMASAKMMKLPDTVAEWDVTDMD